MTPRSIIPARTQKGSPDMLTHVLNRASSISAFAEAVAHEARNPQEPGERDEASSLHTLRGTRHSPGSVFEQKEPSACRLDRDFAAGSELSRALETRYVRSGKA